jgi:hypothetical protein
MKETNMRLMPLLSQIINRENIGDFQFQTLLEATAS